MAPDRASLVEGRPPLGGPRNPQKPPERHMSVESITCPRCGVTSHHPLDVAEGYCGRCHDFLAPSVACPICGAELQAPCSWAGYEPINDPDISHHARERLAEDQP